MSSASSSNLIKVTVRFRNGRGGEIEISNMKSGMDLLEKANELKGSPVYGLKNGARLINVREMIKYIPLEDGDILEEARMEDVKIQNYPKAAYNNSIVRAKLQRGNIHREQVLELLVNSIDDIPKEIVIESNATVDQLKKSLSQLFKRKVQEIGRRQFIPPTTLLGWNDLTGFNRSYDGSTTLDSLNIRSGDTLQEFYLPRGYNRSQILAHQVQTGEVPRDQVFVLNYIPKTGERLFKNAEGYHPIYVLKNTTVNDLKNILAEILNVNVRDLTELHVRPYTSRSPGPTLYLGWKRNPDGSILYDGNVTLVSLSDYMDKVRLVTDDTPRRVLEQQRIQQERQRHQLLVQQERQRQEEMQLKLQQQENDPQLPIQNTRDQHTNDPTNSGSPTGGKRKSRKRKSKKSRKNYRKI